MAEFKAVVPSGDLSRTGRHYNLLALKNLGIPNPLNSVYGKAAFFYSKNVCSSQDMALPVKHGKGKCRFSIEAKPAE